MSLLLFVSLSGLSVLLGLLYAPVLWELGQLWWTDPGYSHGFLVPLISVYLIWNRKESLCSVQVQPSAWGMAILLAGLCLLVAGKITEVIGGGRGALFLQGTSLVLVGTGAPVLLAGTSILKILLFPVIYLMFMVPLPDGIFTLMTLPLQSYATTVTTSALHMLHIPALREGNLIHLPSLTLGVTEACSGIRSLLTLLAGAVALSSLMLSRWWQYPILIASVIPIAIVTNAFRVIGTGLLAYFFGAPAATGFFHGFSGWLFLLIATLLLCMEILILVKLPVQAESEAVV